MVSGFSVITCGARTQQGTTGTLDNEVKTSRQDVTNTNAPTSAKQPTATPSIPPIPAECNNQPDVACIDSQYIDPRPAINAEIEPQLQQLVPRLTACEQKLDKNGDTRILLGLHFDEKGALVSAPIEESTVSDCGVVPCIKQVIKGINLRKAGQEPHFTEIRLTFDPKSENHWHIAPGDYVTERTGSTPVPFIPDVRAREECKDRNSRGALPPDIIQSIVRNEYAMFRACYEQALGRNAKICGRVQVRFVISAKGVVNDVRAVTGTTLNDCAAIECIKGAFTQINFPPPNPPGKVTVVYPIMLVPG